MALLIQSDIHCFSVSSKDKNDSFNKTRENIIKAIINNTIPNEFYEQEQEQEQEAKCQEWLQLKKSVHEYIQLLANDNGLNIEKIECLQKAGRGHHYDFKIIINGENEFNVEFKYNAGKMKQTPQFVSPMKPSQYLSNDYESYYYDNYLVNLGKKYELPIPDRETYLKTIHSTSPACMKEYKLKYDKGSKKHKNFTNVPNDIQFYKDVNSMSKESICKFIEQTELNIEKLSEYLLETQENKVYMLYDVKNNKFNKETINMEDYILTSYEKDTKCKNRYFVYTKSGNKLKVLLRWKNGNGIAFPAFQIS